MYSLVFQPWNQIQAFVNMKLFVVIREKAVGLMSAMILGAETPINIWKDRLIFKVCCSEDTAAYLLSLLALNGDVVKKGVYQLLVHI